MSDTSRRLGRDPWYHKLHEGQTEANRYTGKPGELTGVLDATSREIVQIRMHNGQLAGGFIVPTVPASSSASMVGAAAAVPPMAITQTGGAVVNIAHLLGYVPMVQVLDATGAPVAFTVDHIDGDNLTLLMAADGSYEVILR